MTKVFVKALLAMCLLYAAESLAAARSETVSAPLSVFARLGFEEKVPMAMIVAADGRIVFYGTGTGLVDELPRALARLKTLPAVDDAAALAAKLQGLAAETASPTLGAALAGSGAPLLVSIGVDDSVFACGPCDEYRRFLQSVKTDVRQLAINLVKPAP